MYIGYAENDIECDEKFCISHLELKPEIMLVALTEQIYRGYAINNNITYHK
jgi:23S rRNA (pseudouridine1915-N3)-methyltransferase